MGILEKKMETTIECRGLALGDSVSRAILRIAGVTTWLRTKLPRPSK